MQRIKIIINFFAKSQKICVKRARIDEKYAFSSKDGCNIYESVKRKLPDSKPSYCVEVKTHISSPLPSPPPPSRPPIETPDLLKNLDSTQKQQQPKLKQHNIKCIKPGFICFSKTPSSDAEFEEYRPLLHKDLSTESNEVELPMSSLSKDDSIDSQHIAEENENIFKNGFYAHYWMKADLCFDHEHGQDSLRNPLKMT